ncbi:MAG: cyclase family protein [Streptosporangiales bacterium]|nr:cyclase family protein [Streptosporangiales bacterium]
MSEEPGLPAYDQLELIPELGLRHSWGVFGRGDSLGTVNLLTADRVRAASALVRDGRVFRLDLPITEPDPPMYGRDRLVHTIFSASRNNWDDRLDNFHPQGSTQWDGLRHVRCREFGFYGGYTAEPGEDDLGIEHWARHGIIGRGVLLDLERHLRLAGTPVDPGAEMSIPSSMLATIAREQAVELRPGDVLCVRTGWMRMYRERAAAGEAIHVDGRTPFPGLAADEAMARFLWDTRVAAVVADNPAVEVSPGDPKVGSLHRRIIPLLGMAVGELFVLDELAEAAEADGRFDFLFVSIPMNLPGGVGSPGNAIAIR